MVYRAQIENLESHLAAGNEAVINQLPHSIERDCLNIDFKIETYPIYYGIIKVLNY